MGLNAIWDEAPVDVTTEANFIWSIANKLRGSYMPDKYGDVIIPMVIIRRFECTLEKTKQAVVDMFEKMPTYPYKAMCKISGFQFYNTSQFDLRELCNDADNIAKNFNAYVAGFSDNVKDILNELEIEKHIEKMDKDGCLFSVVKAFSELDLDPETYDSIKMGYIFENLIGRFYQNVDAGQFYTGRDIIKLLCSVLLSEGCDDIFDDKKIITVCDQACGTGGMLSTAFTYLKHYNPSADVRLFGQEFMGPSYAVGKAEMLIKGQNAANFKHTDTLKNDCFPDTKMRFLIENPPFGTPWSGDNAKQGQEDAVKLKRNLQKMAVDGEQGSRLEAILSYCSYSQQSQRWMTMLDVRQSFLTALHCLPAGLRQVSHRLGVGCWKMTWLRRLSRCRMICFTTPASAVFAGFCPRVNARSVSARFS